MKQELGDQSVYRVSVVEGDKSNYFKDGPVPELVKVYTDSVTQEPAPTSGLFLAVGTYFRSFCWFARSC